MSIRSHTQRRAGLVAAVLGVFVTLPGGGIAADETNTDWPVFQLEPDKIWRLNHAGGRFDASGLLVTPSGEMLSVSDRGPSVYRIEFHEATNTASLHALTNCFTPARLAPFAQDKWRHYDTEGLAQDDGGRFYICEEGNRWILRCDPKSGLTERLPIDWTPVKDFFDTDRNASFEGIAIGGDKLYLANERARPVIIVADLTTLKVEDHFTAWPQATSLLGFLHYSGLSWCEGRLWILCRHHRIVIAVDPKTKTVLAEFNYQQLEDGLDYQKELPTGIMEGLAVTPDAIWLVTDNNGLPRIRDSRDIRPTLVRCLRPDRKLPAH
jgi:hypothetical protein